MTMLRERTTSAVRTPVRYVTEWTLGIVGGLMSAIGLWMYYGPADGVLQLFAWDWNVADLSVVWPFSLIIAGGVAMTAAFLSLYRKLSTNGPTTSANVSMGLAVASFALAIVYALIWIF